MVRVAEMAATMDNEFAAQIAAEEARLAAEAEAASLAVEEVVSEDEAVSEAAEASDSAECSVDGSAVPEGDLPEGANRVDSLPFEVYCSGCNETIRRGDPAVHLPGRGAFHPQCATS